jgi:hypothetical protein
MAGTIRGRGNDGEILYEGLEGFLYYCKNTWTAVCLTTLLGTLSWQRMTFAHEQRLLMMWLTNTLAILALGTHLIRLPFDFHSMVQASSSAFAKSRCHRSCNRSRRDVSYRPLPKHPLTALNCVIKMDPGKWMNALKKISNSYSTILLKSPYLCLSSLVKELSATCSGSSTNNCTVISLARNHKYHLRQTSRSHHARDRRARVRQANGQLVLVSPALSFDRLGSLL